MMDIDEINLLLDTFTEYASLNLSPQSCPRYIDVISEYLQNEVVDKISRNDYDSIFDESRINRITRKSLVRPSLLKFLDFLKDEGFIDEDNYLRIKDKVKKQFKNITKPKSEQDFLSPNEIKNIFHEKITYKNDEEALLVPLLCALSFFCMFKQGDTLNLTLSDIDLKKKQIRNIRNDKNNPELVEWLVLDDITYLFLERYLEQRKKQNTEDQKLLTWEGVPLDNTRIGNLFYCFKRKGNKELVNDKAISQELLNRSMILYILTSTKGHGLFKILLEHDLSSSALDYALKEYISYLRDKHKGTVATRYNIQELLPPIRRKSEDYSQHIYSEENDFDKEDLFMFDSFGSNNLRGKKISIQRLVRDSVISRQLKAKYKNVCQLCEKRLRNSKGEYFSEAHHIQPYNKTHRGDDTFQNMIILCPNCHAQFDDLYYAINPNTKLVHSVFEDDPNHLNKLRMVTGHILKEDYLEYTWNLFIDRKTKSQL